MKYILITAVLLIFGYAIANLKLNSANEPPIISVEENNPEMKAAINNARDTLGEFDELLKNDSGVKAIKVGFKIKGHDDMREFCWLNMVKAVNTGYIGKLNNLPKADLGYKLDQEISVGRDDVVDWMYKGTGPAVGNFTLKVLLNKMDVKEAAEVRRAMGW